MDLPYKYETMIRKIFQCGRFDDPLGVLANADSWNEIFSDELSKECVFQAWAVLTRFRLSYLDSVQGRETMLKRAYQLDKDIQNANNNQEIIIVMDAICEMVDTLDLSEHPHLSYRQTNDN